MKKANHDLELIFKTPFYIGLIVTFIVLLLMYLFPDVADYIIIGAYVFTLIYILSIKNRKLLYTLILALLFAVAWLLAGRTEYGYNRDYSVIFGINIYPMLLWAIGLFAIYLVYDYVEDRIPKKFYLKLILFSVIFWICLITVESLAYHVLIIRNAVTGMYPGLPLCDCIHEPRWMQAVYILMGPIFFIMNYLIRKYFTKKKLI